MGWDGMELIDLVQDRDQWRALEHGNESSGFLRYVLNAGQTDLLGLDTETDRRSIT
jgi:hypothetical protein